MTLKKVKKTLSLYNMSIRYRDGEYRVNFVPGKESTAYYTDDLEDAFHTALLMRKRIESCETKSS